MYPNLQRFMGQRGQPMPEMMQPQPGGMGMPPQAPGPLGGIAQMTGNTPFGMPGGMPQGAPPMPRPDFMQAPQQPMMQRRQQPQPRYGQVPPEQQQQEPPPDDRQFVARGGGRGPRAGSRGQNVSGNAGARL